MENNKSEEKPICANCRTDTTAIPRLQKQLEEKEDEISLLREVFKAALDLRNSGSDGPFIGEICQPLFSAINKVEKARSPMPGSIR